MCRFRSTHYHELLRSTAINGIYREKWNTTIMQAYGGVKFATRISQMFQASEGLEKETTP